MTNKEQVQSFISLEAFEAESLVQLLVDSIAYRNNVCGIESFDLALDVCLKAVQIVRDKKLDVKQQMNHQKEVKVASMTSLTSLSNDTVLEICSFMDMRSKCLLRFTSSSVHMAMMRCLFDLTDNFDDDLVGREITANRNRIATIIEQIAPMRLWSSLMRNPCCCNSDASKQLSLVDRRLDPAYFTANNSPLTPSELNSLGFDRSWTITGLTYSCSEHASDLMTLKTMCNTLVKHDSQHMLTTLYIELFNDLDDEEDDEVDDDEVGLSVDEILNIGCEAFCNVEMLHIPNFSCSSNFFLNDIKTFEIFANLRTLNLSQINFVIVSSELSAFSKLEELMLYHCTKIDDFAHIAPLTKLRSLMFHQNVAMMNTSSVSLLTNLSDLFLGVRSGDVLDLKLSHLAGLTKLTMIDLRDSRVEGNIESLSQLKNLTALTLDVGVTSGDLSVLTNFTNLQKLSVCNDRAERCAMSPPRGNIQVLTHLIRLKELTFSGFNLQGNIAALSQCSGLEQLDLSALQLQGDISVLSTLTKLSDCALGLLPSINGDISAFSNIPRVTVKNCVCLTGNKTAVIVARSHLSFPVDALLLIDGCPDVS
jgi:hypothetical protein